MTKATKNDYFFNWNFPINAIREFKQKKIIKFLDWSVPHPNDGFVDLVGRIQLAGALGESVNFMEAPVEALHN